MLLELPLTTDASQEFTTQLAEVSYTVRAQYNDLAAVWTLDLLTEDGTPILLGLAIVLGVDLLQPYNSVPGYMIAVDLSSQNKDALPDDIGTRVVLFWFDNDEIVNV